jgi:hypothetical protein
MKHQADLTKMLREAKGCLGMDRIKSLLPRPLGIWISDHDTGCQIQIQLAEEGQLPVGAWQGSIWYSSSYEFNDRDKVLGLNPKVAFVGPTLEEFFEMVETALANYKANQIANTEASKEADRLAHEAAVEHYRAKF